MCRSIPARSRPTGTARVPRPRAGRVAARHARQQRRPPSSGGVALPVQRSVSLTLKRRRAGQPRAAVDAAWRAPQLRLHRRRLAHLDAARAGGRTTVAVAVARALACFVWELARRPSSTRSPSPFRVTVAAGAAPHGPARIALSSTSPGWRARFSEHGPGAAEHRHRGIQPSHISDSWAAGAAHPEPMKMLGGRPGPSLVLRGASEPGYQ